MSDWGRVRFIKLGLRRTKVTDRTALMSRLWKLQFGEAGAEWVLKVPERQVKL